MGPSLADRAQENLVRHMPTFYIEKFAGKIQYKQYFCFYV